MTQYEKNCINYIYNYEADDFWRNASKDHVYFSAMVALFGMKYAEKILDETLEIINKESQNETD